MVRDQEQLQKLKEQANEGGNKKSRKSIKFYFIDKKKLESNFHLILDRYDLIPEIAELNKANNELVLYDRWRLYDIVTVMLHLLFIFLIPLPILAVILLYRIQYVPYSLIPT